MSTKLKMIFFFLEIITNEFKIKDHCNFLKKICKSKRISQCKISIYFAKKTYFFYFTHPFLQNTHISLSILLSILFK